MVPDVSLACWPDNCVSLDSSLSGSIATKVEQDVEVCISRTIGSELVEFMLPSRRGCSDASKLFEIVKDDTADSYIKRNVNCIQHLVGRGHAKEKNFGFKMCVSHYSTNLKNFSTQILSPNGKRVMHLKSTGSFSLIHYSHVVSCIDHGDTVPDDDDYRQLWSKHEMCINYESRQPGDVVYVNVQNGAVVK